jgi:hypothetical protein
VRECCGLEGRAPERADLGRSTDNGGAVREDFNAAV